MAKAGIPTHTSEKMPDVRDATSGIVLGRRYEWRVFLVLGVEQPFLVGGIAQSVVDIHIEKICKRQEHLRR